MVVGAAIYLSTTDCGDRMRGVVAVLVVFWLAACISFLLFWIAQVKMFARYLVIQMPSIKSVIIPSHSYLELRSDIVLEIFYRTTKKLGRLAGLLGATKDVIFEGHLDAPSQCSFDFVLQIIFQCRFTVSVSSRQILGPIFGIRFSQ